MASMIAPDALEFGSKMGTELLEKQKNLVKIPDLKDVDIEDALRILKDELDLSPVAAISNPSLAYADESVNDVMSSEPRFGSKVNPKTIVKVYYLTQEVIDKSKELLAKEIKEFKTPEVVGLNLYEAREDLACLGLKVTTKLEIPSLRFASVEDNQVTRMMRPNNRRIGSKLKTGDRVWLYYVNEEVILESKAIKDKKEKDRQDKIDKVGKVPKDINKWICTGAADASHVVTKNIKKPFKKKVTNLDKKED